MSFPYDQLPPRTVLRIWTTDNEVVDVSVRNAGRAWLDCTILTNGEDVTLVCIPLPRSTVEKHQKEGGRIMEHAIALIETGMTVFMMTGGGNVLFEVQDVQTI